MKTLDSKLFLTINLRIRFQSRIYQIRLDQLVRWIVPVIVIITRVISHFRANASS